jgi:hypothetical protein
MCTKQCCYLEAHYIPKNNGCEVGMSLNMIYERQKKKKKMSME